MLSFPVPIGPGAGYPALNGWPITQDYGHNGHPGIDVGTPTGTPLLAVLAGTIEQFRDGSASSAGGGNWTNLHADDGWIYGYGHAVRFTVANGSRIELGQELARSGSTGYSTGPHLHFCRRRPGQPWTDPRPFLATCTNPTPPPTPHPNPEPKETDTMRARWYLNTDTGDHYLWIPGTPAQHVEEVAAQDAWNAGLLQNGTPAPVPGAFIAGIIPRP